MASPFGGGVKFFDRSKSLFEDGNTATASSAPDSANRAIDRNRFTRWRSVGSMDTITETFTITFQTAQSFNRLLLIDMNFKEFTVQYDSGGGLTDFTTVVGLDGALVGGISETTFADSSAYYQFDTVTGVTTLELTMTTTQVVDAEKFINQIIATTEFGTFEGYPVIKGVNHSRNSRVKEMISGRSRVQKSIDSVTMKMDFRNYPNTLKDDIDLVYDLHDSEQDFLVWLCGGRRGTDFFRYTQRGWRLEDVYPMQFNRDLPASYSKNVTVLPVNLKISLVETV